MRVRAVVMAALLGVAAAGSAAQARELGSWRMAPEPRWVVAPPAASPERGHPDDAVAPDEAQRFFQTVDQIHHRAGYVLRRGAAAARPGWFETPGDMAGMIVFSVLPLAGLLAGVRAGWLWRRRRRVKARYRMGTGDAAATAIEARTEADIDARMAEVPCACGALYRAETKENDQRVTYNGRTLVVRTVLCGDCQQRRALYFTVAEQ